MWGEVGGGGWMLERQRCRETCRSRDMWGVRPVWVPHTDHLTQSLEQGAISPFFLNQNGVTYNNRDPRCSPSLADSRLAHGCFSTSRESLKMKLDPYRQDFSKTFPAKHCHPS